MAREITLGEALVEGLAEAMDQNPRVILIGGGLVSSGPAAEKFRSIRQLHANRIKSPPIAELGYCGIAAGAAMAGLRPLVDIGTATFSYEAIPQINNEAAVAYSNSGGQTNVPVTYFMRYGIRGGGGVQHSGSPQSWYWNTPGLQVAMPATPADAKGLLRTALLKSHNPTIFFAHERLLGERGIVPDGEHETEFGQAAVAREGSDVTIIATGVQVPRALAAAEALAIDGILAEVVDPRTLEPLDTDTLLESVRKTGRLVVTDESHDNCGVAAGLAAVMADLAFNSLKAPIKRVAIPNVPVPFAVPLENYVTPTADRIEAAARSVMA